QRLADEFGALCKAIFAVERRPDGATHQAAAGDGGKHGRGKPADGNPPAIDRLLDVAVKAERGLVAQFDLGRRNASAACRSSPALQAILAPLGPRTSGRMILLQCPARYYRNGTAKTPL